MNAITWKNDYENILILSVITFASKNQHLNLRRSNPCKNLQLVPKDFTLPSYLRYEQIFDSMVVNLGSCNYNKPWPVYDAKWVPLMRI